MDSLDKYGFDNPLKMLGIDDIFDIDALRKKCSSLIVNIKDELFNRNKPSLDSLNQMLEDLEDKKSKASDDLAFEYDRKIEKVKNDIANINKQREKWYKDLDETITEVYSTDNISFIIHKIIKLTDNYMLFKPRDDRDKELRTVIKDLKSALKSPEDVKKFLIKKVFIINYIDTENMDMSKYTYTGNGKTRKGLPEYIYGAKPTDEPKKILDMIDETGDRVQAYKIGRYAFGQYAISEDHYAYGSGEYDIFTVLRYSKNGELRTYNGIINCNSNDILNIPNFYGLVVFSDFVMENAEKNNFGYIGSVYLDKDGQKRLGFNNNIEARDLVTSLSFAQNYEGRFINLSDCKTIQDFFCIMNQKVKEISDIEKPVGPDFDDEGRK